jgi:hypothetical protein
MSSKTLEGMARVHYGTFAGVKPENVIVDDIDRAAMKAALLWLADNVSDEMVKALRDSLDECPPDKWLPAIGYAKAISAALRAAGDGR